MPKVVRPATPNVPVFSDYPEGLIYEAPWALCLMKENRTYYFRTMVERDLFEQTRKLTENCVAIIQHPPQDWSWYNRSLNPKPDQP